jgi:hypothetical protein
MRHKAVEYLQSDQSIGQKVGPFTYNEDPCYAWPQLEYHIEPFLFNIYDDDEK